MDHVSKFKELMGNYPTGVTVVTTVDENQTPVGLTVNSFASVSLEPMLILWSIDKKVSSHELFITTDKFAVNILAADQGDVLSVFATKGVDRFAQCEWTLSPHGLPVLSGTAGVFQCRTFKRVDAGDHTILIGEVIDIESHAKEPILYHRRTFGRIPEEFYSKRD